MTRSLDTEQVGRLYRKTALVWAEQFLPTEGKIPAGVISDELSDPRRSTAEWVLDTLEGRHTLRAGDYICTGPKGERWNVEQSIFETTYEPAEAATPATSQPGTKEREAVRSEPQNPNTTGAELLAAAKALVAIENDNGMGVIGFGEAMDRLEAAITRAEASTAEDERRRKMLEMRALMHPDEAATREEEPEGPGGWLVKDFADGWFWTPHRITAVAALTEGHSVFDLKRQAYAIKGAD